jgi:hypothetical protein
MPGQARLSLVRQCPLLRRRFSFQDEVRGSERPRPQEGNPPSSRHLTSPLTVPCELRRCRLAWRSPPTRSHGGSQGFKSPHLHPQTSRSERRRSSVGGAHRVPGPRWGREHSRNRSTTAAPWWRWADQLWHPSGYSLGELAMLAWRSSRRSRRLGRSTRCISRRCSVVVSILNATTF